jgi:uncharacterized protein
MIIVSDTSPISNLLQIGEIELLRLTFSRVIIPDAVYREICEVEANRVALIQLDWIERMTVSDTTLRDRLLLTVDPGEADAIALAVELSADYLLIDEAIGRSVARDLGLNITGLLGVLLRAKRDGHITQIKPYLDKLVNEVGFRLSAALIDDALYQAGEK